MLYRYKYGNCLYLPIYLYYLLISSFRPESYREDVETAKHLGPNAGVYC